MPRVTCTPSSLPAPGQAQPARHLGDATALAFGDRFVVMGSEPIAIAIVMAVNDDGTRFVFGNGAKYHVRIRQARSAAEQSVMLKASLGVPHRGLEDCFILEHERSLFCLPRAAPRRSVSLCDLGDGFVLMQESRPPLTGLPSRSPTNAPSAAPLVTPPAALDTISVCQTEVAEGPDDTDSGAVSSYGGASSDSDESVPLDSSMSGSGDAGSELGLTRKRSAEKEPADSAGMRRRQRRLEERAAAKEQRITEAEGVDDGGYSMLPRGVLRASGGVIATGDERTCLPDSMSVVKCLLHGFGLTASDSRKTVRWFSDRLRSDPLRLDTADPHIGDAKAFAAEHGIDLQHKHNWSPRLLVNADTGVFVARTSVALHHGQKGDGRRRHDARL